MVNTSIIVLYFCIFFFFILAKYSQRIFVGIFTVIFWHELMQFIKCYEIPTLKIIIYVIINKTYSFFTGNIVPMKILSKFDIGFFAESIFSNRIFRVFGEKNNKIAHYPEYVITRDAVKRIILYIRTRLLSLIFFFQL